MKKHLWCEDYRPKKIEDCILPKRLKEFFQAQVDKKQIQNSTFVSGPGTGKTTVAKAMCEELGIDYLVINASEDGNIETIRTKVRQFGSSRSFEDNIRCVIMDEADYLTPLAQAALRNMIEEFAGNCRFIFTGNYENRIIDPIKSRCPVVDFTFTKEEKKELVISFDRRIKMILAEEGIQYDKTTLAEIVIQNFPDFRKTINLLQRYSHSGSLVVNGAGAIDDEKFKVLCTYLKEKRFTDMRKWVAENLDNDGAMLRRALYDKMSSVVDKSSIPQLVLIINSYDHKESFVVDKEVNTVAMMVEIMADVKFA